MSNPPLQDKIAVVTGGASGIGLAVSERLATEGAQVIISDINAEAGIIVADQVGAIFMQADLSRRADCQSLVAYARETFGAVHILVNNAGFQHIAPVEDFPEDAWDALLAVMLTAPFLLTKYTWPLMKAQGWGRIINMASIHGQVASPFKSGYISAKHGLIGLTRTTALEGGTHGITVNAICPGYVRTPLVENQIADQAQTHHLTPEEVVTKIMLEPAAIKRLIEPAEVAALAAYLCSDAAGVITGATLNIDLGWTAR